ncbi:MAG: glycosyltransferase family 9 protein [Bacteroidetes bacterium]|nr:glycosyltransferase family 9 protein [Bacteroidota bacterium]
MAGLIKKYFPKSKIIFLGRTYTKDVIALSEHVDEFLNYDELEKLDKKNQKLLLREVHADVIIHVFPKKRIAFLARSVVPLRVGTTNRLYHWLTCNKLIRLSRKNSYLHESQLNLKLLDFLKINTEVPLKEIYNYYGFNKVPALDPVYTSLIDKNKFNVILHPKSKGSAKEWGLENFSKLIDLLNVQKYQVFISGTAEDGKLMQDFLHAFPRVINLTGKLSLQQFIAFIAECDSLVAASTGPLHIAAALNKKAIGLFSTKRPIHPGRWMPLGKDAHYVVFDENCERCFNNEDCDCIRKINPQQVVDLIEQHGEF